jgi:hypothetical protein
LRLAEVRRRQLGQASQEGAGDLGAHTEPVAFVHVAQRAFDLPTQVESDPIRSFGFVKPPTLRGAEVKGIDPRPRPSVISGS